MLKLKSKVNWLSVKAGMGNRGTEWRVWWERKDDGNDGNQGGNEGKKGGNARNQGGNAGN